MEMRIVLFLKGYIYELVTTTLEIRIFIHFPAIAGKIMVFKDVQLLGFGIRTRGAKTRFLIPPAFTKISEDAKDKSRQVDLTFEHLFAGECSSHNVSRSVDANGV